MTRNGSITCFVFSLPRFLRWRAVTPTSIPCQPALIRAGAIEASFAAARLDVACSNRADLETLIASARSSVQAARKVMAECYKRLR